MPNETVDVLIIGSGPAGSTYGRTLVERYPDWRIMMVDLGAQLSTRPGANAKNAYLYNYGADGLNALSQVVNGELTVASTPVAAPWPETLDPSSQPRVLPVTYQMNGENPEQADWDNLPAASSSFNVGGMGAHWTCITPRPAEAERIPFFDARGWDALMSAAEALVHTTQDAFTSSLRGQVIGEALSAVFDDHLPEGRQVQMLPLACERWSEGWVQWTGVDTILGALAEPGVIPAERFQLRAETICRRLIIEGTRVRAAELEHLPTGKRTTVTARTYVVAANTIYTPQLLWASGIRLPALGRYFADQPMLFGQVVLSQALLARIAERWSPPPPDVDPVPIPRDDPIPTVWIPFSDPAHPFHSQIHRDAFPYNALPEDAGVDHRTIVDLLWFCRKDLRAQDHVTFSERYVDQYGMPQPTFHYTLSDDDRQTVHAAFDDMTRAASLLGGYLPGRESAILPRGSSLHYQGTTRMGRDNNNESVCDPFSKVWDFENLYVGGNGVIPTSTACNPTLTSIALALHSCNAIGEAMTS
jgi:pyranose oxidase